MFSTKIRGGKAFAAEQKIREFKKLLLKSKRLYKSTSSRRLEPKKLAQRAVNNMNKIASQKYVFSPGFVEEKTLNDEKFRKIYDFHRLVKVRKFAERYERSDIKSDRRFHKKLRSPLEISEKVLVLTEKLKKKKMHLAHCIKVQQKTCHFLIVNKYLLLEKYYQK